jgi:hypothetical protein
LTTGVATGSSTSREGGTGFDVPVGGASFSTRAPKTPGDYDTSAKKLRTMNFCSTMSP